jgi:sugar lactone lactonase YvrE
MRAARGAGQRVLTGVARITVRRVLLWLLAAAVLIVAYLLFWPTPLDPYAWTPPPNPGTGANSPFHPSQPLTGKPLAGDLIAARYSAAGRPVNFGPEDVAVSPLDGKVYTGIGDGSLLRIDPASGITETFTNTGGRPLGVTFDASGRTLYVSDAHLGLLSVDVAGRVEVLVNEAQGESVTFADNLDVAGDGTVWFSAPTREHTFEQVELDVWDSRPSGRLLRYDPVTREARVVLDNLFYANGVAMAADDSFVLVAEFLGFRIQRYWLTGPKAGSHELFVDGLPGYPDNITRTPQGTFLVGLSLQRIPGLDKQRPRPWAVEAIYRLPGVLKPKAQYPGYLLEFDARGRLVSFAAHETKGDVAQVTAGTVLPSDGMVMLGAAPDRGREVVVGSLQVESVRRLRLEPVVASVPAPNPQ